MNERMNRDVFDSRSLLHLFAIVLLVFGSSAISSAAETNAKEPAVPDQQQTDLTVLVGTYTTFGAPKGEGIYVYRINAATGALSLLHVAKDVPNPSYLAVDPSRRRLLCVNEVGKLDDVPGGGFSAFSLDPQTAALSFLNRQPSLGAAPCYVTIERTGRFALVANYGQGNVAMFPIQADGRVGPASDSVQHEGSSADAGRQKGPHAHCIVIDPGNRYALAADLGIDAIVVYRMDLEKGKLVRHREVKVKPGAGPRHLAFHPNDRWLYLINELNSTITAFTWNADDGSLAELQTISTLPDGFGGQSFCADVHVHPSGRFVYGSNRGHDSLAMFSVDEKTGKLASLGHQPTGGKTPRNFALDPTGTWLLAANQDSGNIVTFRIDGRTGNLQQTEQVTSVGMPVCVKFADLREGGTR